jgi:hypothetical protein
MDFVVTISFLAFLSKGLFTERGDDARYTYAESLSFG